VCSCRLFKVNQPYDGNGIPRQSSRLAPHSAKHGPLRAPGRAKLSGHSRCEAPTLPRRSNRTILGQELLCPGRKTGQLGLLPCIRVLREIRLQQNWRDREVEPLPLRRRRYIKSMALPTLMLVDLVAKDALVSSRCGWKTSPTHTRTSPSYWLRFGDSRCTGLPQQSVARRYSSPDRSTGAMNSSRPARVGTGPKSAARASLCKGWDWRPRLASGLLNSSSRNRRPGRQAATRD